MFDCGNGRWCALRAAAPVSDTVINPLAIEPTAAADGQRVYDGTCQTCHGPAGVGDRRARRARTQRHGTETWRRRRRSVPHHSSGRSGHADAALQRAARRAGLAARQLYPQSAEHRRVNGGARGAAVPEGDVAAGEALFFGKAACASCHEVNARGGSDGPDLSNAGRLAAATIRQKIVSPNDPLPPVPGARGGGRRPRRAATGHARRADGGRTRSSRRQAQRRQFSAQMVDASGQLHLIDKLQHAVVCREPLADAGRLRHASVGGRHHEPRRVSRGRRERAT